MEAESRAAPRTGFTMARGLTVPNAEEQTPGAKVVLIIPVPNRGASNPPPGGANDAFKNPALLRASPHDHARNAAHKISRNSLNLIRSPRLRLRLLERLGSPSPGEANSHEQFAYRAGQSAEAVEVADFRSHDLRHTWASGCVQMDPALDGLRELEQLGNGDRRAPLCSLVSIMRPTSNTSRSRVQYSGMNA